MKRIDYFKHTFECWESNCKKETSRITMAPMPPEKLFCAHCHVQLLVEHCSESTYENPPRLDSELLAGAIIFGCLVMGKANEIYDERTIAQEAIDGVTSLNVALKATGYEKA